MSDDKVVRFPGRSDAPDLLEHANGPGSPGERLTSAQLLQKAIDAGVEDVVIVGRTADGALWVGSEAGEIDATIGKLQRGVLYLSMLDDE
jgi:hypothetical protein